MKGVAIRYQLSALLLPSLKLAALLLPLGTALKRRVEAQRQRPVRGFALEYLGRTRLVDVVFSFVTFSLGKQKK